VHRRKLDCAALQILPDRAPLAWVIGNAEVAAPIIGASKPQHLDDAIAALDITSTPEERAALEAPYVPHAIAGFLSPEVKSKLTITAYNFRDGQDCFRVARRPSIDSTSVSVT
jgi:hypothetical protein